MVIGVGFSPIWRADNQSIRNIDRMSYMPKFEGAKKHKLRAGA